MKLERQPAVQLSTRCLSLTELRDAKELVRDEWGTGEAGLFMNEALKQLEHDDGAVYGAFHPGGRLIGIAMVSKEQIDFASWCGTWLVVRPECRQQGAAAELTRAVIKHATQAYEQEKTGRYPTEYAELQITTGNPRYYERFGFREVYRCKDKVRMRLMLGGAAVGEPDLAAKISR